MNLRGTLPLLLKLFWLGHIYESEAYSAFPMMLIAVDFAHSRTTSGSTCGSRTLMRESQPFKSTSARRGAIGFCWASFLNCYLHCPLNALRVIACNMRRETKLLASTVRKRYLIYAAGTVQMGWRGMSWVADASGRLSFLSPLFAARRAKSAASCRALSLAPIRRLRCGFLAS